jgi:dual specificity tyrosine-phosphorylation-regulated kinase 2/3/4
VLSRASSAEESNGSTGKCRPGRLHGRGAEGGLRSADPCGAADGRVRKFQRTSGTDHTRRKSSAPSVTAAPRPPPQDHSTKTNFRGRRQSVRDHKVPLGPRPYEKQR